MNINDAKLLLVTESCPDLVERAEAAVRGGVDIVQLREKEGSREELLPMAEELKRICEAGGALFTVNDDAELARLCGVGGVHLGQEDMSLAEAREALGAEAVIGRSAGSVGEVMDEVESGADYLGVGAVYGTPTKPEGDVAGLDLIREISRRNLPVPWFAIGGVTLETAAEVAAAGAPGFAVVRAIMDAEDPEGAARRLRSHLEH